MILERKMDEEKRFLDSLCDFVSPSLGKAQVKRVKSLQDLDTFIEALEEFLAEKDSKFLIILKEKESLKKRFLRNLGLWNDMRNLRLPFNERVSIEVIGRNALTNIRLLSNVTSSSSHHHDYDRKDKNNYDSRLLLI